MVKAIIFDCFGVLTGDKWKEFLATLDGAQVQPARDLNHALDRGFISQAEFFAKISELTGRAPERVEEVINSDMHKNQPLLDYIATLKPNYKVGLLSNVSSNWVRESFLNDQEQTLFDDILLSYDVGLIKPEPAIFKLSAKRRGWDTADCRFSDDSPGHCEGAEQTGMQAIVYKDFVQFKADIAQLLS